MPRVTGLGGDFFKSENPEKLYHWYEKHLGITREPHGQSASFRWHEPDGAEGLTAWALFPKDTTYFDPSPAPFMLNYRVDDLDGLLQALAHSSPLLACVGTSSVAAFRTHLQA